MRSVSPCARGRAPGGGVSARGGEAGEPVTTRTAISGRTAAVDPQIDRWRQSAERLVPDLDRQDAADTVSLAAGTEREVQANVANGSYRVTVVCVGGGDSSVRISLSDSGADSGHGLDCSGNQRPFDFPVAVAGQLRINVSVGEAGPVVFRYTVLKAEN